MLKRLLISLAILAGLLAPVHAAGTVPGFSLTPQFDKSGKPAPGCKLNVIQAGTTSTPQIAYQDSALTIPAPGGSQLTCDASARLPQFFLADGQIKFRLTDKNGIEIFSQDNLLVVGPSTGGGGGGGQVDPTTIFATGDTLWSDTSGTRTGWVRDNGRTIGSASSGATERANSDTEALFNFLWQTYDNTICAVSGGRGVSSAADWAANKTIATPDKRGYIPGGLDDMGNSAAGRWANVPVVSGSVTTPGSVIGEALHTLLAAEMPAHQHDVFLKDPGHGHGIPTFGTTAGDAGGITVLGGSCCGASTQNAFTNLQLWSGSGGTGTQNKTASLGGGGAANTVQKTVLGTFFRKL